jgi:sterol desaturase/sphingolipid hydroxylase (fatty acid hydroxylase superfamily)
MHGNPEALQKFPLIGNPLARTARIHLNHHMTVQSDMTLKDHVNDNSLIFTMETTYQSMLLVIPLLVLSRQFTIKEAMAVSVGVSIVYSILWNSIHTKMHGQEVSPKWNSVTPINALAHRNAVYDFLWKYHAVHHVQKGSEKTNYNIVLPGMDFIFGTYGGWKSFDNTEHCFYKDSKDPRCHANDPRGTWKDSSILSADNMVLKIDGYE